VLRIRKDRRELGTLEVVEDAVAHFARYLPIPISVAGTAINAATLPWAPQAGREAIAIDDLARAWCRLGEPLATLELQPFEDPELGRIALHGVLVIPEGSQLSIHELGDVGVLIRRMLISTRERELLPPWARFVTGLVDCAALEPTASREQVRRGPELIAVQRAIAQQVLGWLERLQTESETWRAILDGHGSVVKTWAARHPELFDVVADHVQFRTTRGTMTLPAYLEATGEAAVYYFDDDVEARAMALLLESSSRPVIDAQYTGDVAFLRTYAEARDVRLVRQLEAEQGALSPLSPAPPELALLASWLIEPDLAVEIARFAPSSLPGFVRVPPRTHTQERTRRALDTAGVHSALRGLLGEYTARPPEHAAARRTLFLNADNPLIQQLAARASDDPRGHARAAAQLVAAMARLVAGETLAPSSLLSASQAASAALGALIGAEPTPGRPIPIGWATDTAGLSPKHARLVVQHFPTFEALIAANDRELAAALGLPVAMATALRALAGEPT
jgi:molecular chaperone HtpG